MNTKTILVCLSLLVFITGIEACLVKGSGKIEKQQRELPSFNGIELRCNANVYVDWAEKQSFSIEGEDFLLDKIKTDVEDGVLVIDMDRIVSNNSSVNIHINVKQLCILELTGSGMIETSTAFSCDNFRLRVSGSGEIRSSVRAQTMKATLAGSGILLIKGTAGTSDLRVSGSGSINAQELKSDNCSVSISGSGIAKLDVSGELVANITGTGNVCYVNEPLKIRSRITGSGEIIKL